jgi:uncharacterized protein (TIGR00730 family)
LKQLTPHSPTTSTPPRRSRPKPAKPRPLNGKPTLGRGPVRSVCVCCGSGKGENPAYAEAARTLGRSLAESGVALVYGGGGLGLMGELARSTLEHGGKVTGIIPEFLIGREHMLREVTDLVVTEDMHERKKLMFERSDAFVALPGGVGTLEELVEQLTWAQLGRHKKPIVVADIAGFWQPFIELLGHMRQEAFIRAGLEVRFGVVKEADQILSLVHALYEEADGVIDPATTIKF